MALSRRETFGQLFASRFALDFCLIIVINTVFARRSRRVSLKVSVRSAFDPVRREASRDWLIASTAPPNQPLRVVLGFAIIYTESTHLKESINLNRIP